MYFIPQVTKSGCGFTCLKMLLATTHRDERYLFLKEDETHGPSNYQELVNYAQHYGVTLIGVNYDNKKELKDSKRFPFIASIKTENGSLHAVLLTKRKGNHLKIQDPSKGVYWMKFEQFIKIWDGTGLVINHVEVRPFTSRIIDVKSYFSEITSYILQTLAAAFIALATFFVKPNDKLILPLIFCALSLACEIVLRVFLLKRMQKCDKYLRRFIPYVQRKDYFEYYRRSQDYKRNALTLGLNFVFYLLVVILIATISIINSISFAICIGVAFLAAFIEVSFLTPLKREINKELEVEEDELRRTKEAEDMEMQVKTMEVKSYRYAYLSFASKVIFGAFFVIASFFVCKVENSSALPNLVFTTCVSYLMYQYLVPLFSYDNSVVDTMVAKARLNNLIQQNENDSKKP